MGNSKVYFEEFLMVLIIYFTFPNFYIFADRTILCHLYGK